MLLLNTLLNLERKNELRCNQGRKNHVIREKFRDELEKTICAIIRNHKYKAYAIYCNPDHTHVFVGMHPSIAPAKLMEQVKSGSSKWIRAKKYNTRILSEFFIFFLYICAYKIADYEYTNHYY